jgi:dUTPase
VLDGTYNTLIYSTVKIILINAGTEQGTVTQHAQLQRMMFQNTKHLKMATADMARSAIL